MHDPLTLLHTSLGQPGSGRVRYGAAMALYREGQITAEVLEVYRVASAHDGQDPVAICAERGLPLPPKTVPLGPLARLYAEARDYLLALSHPGAEEVRQGLPLDPGLDRQLAPKPNAVVAECLASALATLAPTHPTLAAAIGAAAGQLEWITYDAYPLEQIGEAFANGHAFASIRGEAGPFQAQDFDLGLFLIRPHTLYRDHFHAAPELYAPLTGPHGWRFMPMDPLQIKPAHQPVWNPPMRPHLTKTGAVPFLALFVWTCDVNLPAQVMGAPDWAKLEAEAIG